MNNNTITPKESDPCGNKRKRSLKENEGKASQKKTLWSYFRSSKTEGPDNLNGTDVKPEISVSEGQTSDKKSSDNEGLQSNMEIVDEKTEPEKNSQEISQSDFELKSPISRPEKLNEAGVESETSSVGQISASTSATKTSKTEESKENVKSVNEIKESEKTNQECLQMASLSAFNDEGSENLNGTEIKPEISVSESQSSASTSQEKASENEGSQDIVKSVDDNKEQEETNQENLQMDPAVNGPENLNETEIKPGTSSESQASASTSAEKASENEDNEDDVESVDEMEETEKTNKKSSQVSSEFKSPCVDWRSGSSEVTCLPKKAMDEGLFTDIQFVMGKGDMRRKFHAHKLILALASSVFEEMFFGELPEEKSIIETDDDPDAFEMLLDYIYGTSYSISSSNSLTSVCKFSIIGNKYLVPRIQNTVKTRISIIRIAESDFWDVFQLSNFDSLWPLFRDKLDSYIMENAEVLIPSEKFLNVPETIVNSILQMNKLNIEEYPLLIAVTKWVYHNKDQVTSKILMEYYKHIRFSTITKYSFITFIDSYPEAFDAETCIQILHHIQSPYQHNLPEWCIPSETSRVEELEESKHGRSCSCYRCYNVYY